MIRSDFYVESALQRVGHRLFQPRPGTLLEIRREYTAPHAHEGAEFERYAVSELRGGELGTFTRMRVYPGDETTLDLALQFEEGELSAVEAIRPVVLDGIGFLSLPVALEPLKDFPISQYAEPLSRVFQSLAYLEDASAESEDVLQLSRQDQEAVRQWVQQTRPPLPPGSKMPGFSVATVDGIGLTPRSFKGRRSAILFALVQDEDSRKVMDWMHRYGKERSGRFRMAEMLQNSEKEIAGYRVRGGELGEMTAIDDDGAVHDQFQVGFMPALFVFDTGGALVRQEAPPFASYEALRDILDGVR